MNKREKNTNEVNSFPSLEEGDKLTFVPEIAGDGSNESRGESKGEREFIVERLLGEGEYTKVWLVIEKSAEKGVRQFAIKILNRKGNSEDEEDFRNEIKNTETMFKIVSKREKDGSKNPFVVEIGESGTVRAENASNKKGNDNNRKNGNLCFLMEPADCSLKGRIQYFNSEGACIELKDDTPEGKKKSYSRMMWAFYCMRHLIAICEKIRGSRTKTVISHCNIKPENILYFIIKPEKEDISYPSDKPEVVRTPMLTDFRLAEFPKKTQQKTANKGNSEKRRKDILKKSVYAAPELKKEEGATVLSSTDVYSLGIIFYELIKGDLLALSNSDGDMKKNLEEDINQYFEEIDKYFFNDEGEEQRENQDEPKKPRFKEFIEKTLSRHPNKRYSFGKIDESEHQKKYLNRHHEFSEFRNAFMDLEDRFMKNLIKFFKKDLLKPARALLIEGKMEAAINKIDLLFPESVRYSCLKKEDDGCNEIAEDQEEYARKTCCILNGVGGDNAMDKMKRKLPKANVPYGKVKRMSKGDIEEVFVQLEKVLEQCYGFMSHCYSHRYYRERLRRLLTSCGEPKEDEQPYEFDIFENMILSIFKTQ